MPRKTWAALAALAFGAPSFASSAAKPSCDALLFAYFGGDPYAEALHYAVSTDGGFHYAALNGGRPVLNSTVGFNMIRDPFLARVSPDQGGGFRLVHTNVPPSWTGTTIAAWASSDLVSFTNGTVLEVVPSKADDPEWVTWAPEFMWDEAEGHFLLFWAGGDGDLKNIWAATIGADFSAATLGAPFVLLDAGYTTIDGDMVKSEDDGLFYLFFKDERGSNSNFTRDKAVRVVASASPSGPFDPQAISGLLSPHLTEGPTALAAPDPADGFLLYYDCFMDGVYGMSTSTSLGGPFNEVEGSSCNGYGPNLGFPPGPRHGSVLCVTSAELAILEGVFPA